MVQGCGRTAHVRVVRAGERGNCAGAGAAAAAAATATAAAAAAAGEARSGFPVNAAAPSPLESSIKAGWQMQQPADTVSGASFQYPCHRLRAGSRTIKTNMKDC